MNNLFDEFIGKMEKVPYRDCTQFKVVRGKL